MAHLIDMTNALPAIAFRGELPWHGLGQSMEDGESLDAWRIRAGLDWQAKLAPVKFATGGDATQGFMPELRDFDQKAVLYRDDTNAPLGIVSPRYQIVQPRDVIEFYRDLTERHGFQMETAGAIKDGRVVWALARTGDAMRIAGNDVVKGYLLLSTSYDGSMATTGRFTTIRVVCNNTLTAAHDSKPQVSVPHSTLFNMDAAKIKLGVGDAFTRFEEEAGVMAERTVTTRQAIDFFLAVYHDAKAEALADSPKLQKSADKTIERLAQHFLAGPGAELRSAKGTAWGLLNAVTYDIDHASRSRTRDAALTSAWFGKGEQIKNRARELALAFAA